MIELFVQSPQDEEQSTLLHGAEGTAGTSELADPAASQALGREEGFTSVMIPNVSYISCLPTSLFAFHTKPPSTLTVLQSGSVTCMQMAPVRPRFFNALCMNPSLRYSK